MSTDAAERLTARIQLRLDNIADNLEAVVPMIAEAKAANAHQALGYQSWPEYVADKFGGVLGRLDRSERQPLVLLLAEQGMSTRAIGSVVGASVGTVHSDLAGVQDRTPGPVTGTYGKTYYRRDPAAVAEDTPTSFRIPVTLAEASVELESIDASLTELRREQHAMRCYIEAYESYRGDDR